MEMILNFALLVSIGLLIILLIFDIGSDFSCQLDFNNKIYWNRDRIERLEEIVKANSNWTKNHSDWILEVTPIILELIDEPVKAEQARKILYEELEKSKKYSLKN